MEKGLRLREMGEEILLSFLGFLNKYFGGILLYFYWAFIWISFNIFKNKNTCIYMAKSLCCPPETITTLLISYTPI